MNNHIRCEWGVVAEKGKSTLLHGEPCNQTSDLTRHRAAGANECAACHAESQHPRSALSLSFHSLKDCVEPQRSPSHWNLFRGRSWKGSSSSRSLINISLSLPHRGLYSLSYRRRP